jgi:hypothetical protein
MENAAPPEDIAASPLPRIVIAVLLVVVVAAGAYIVHLHGRVAELEQRMARPSGEVPAPAAPAAGAPAAAAPAAPVASDYLTPEQEQAMVAALRVEPEGPGRRAWLLAQQNNTDTMGVQLELQQVFRQAGWQVELRSYPAPLKAGITLLAADEQPSTSANTVDDAFIAANVDSKFLTGYRDYYNLKKSEDPNWRGPELAADQPFMIVVGSKPMPRPPAEPGGAMSNQQ